MNLALSWSVRVCKTLAAPDGCVLLAHGVGFLALSQALSDERLHRAVYGKDGLAGGLLELGQRRLCTLGDAPASCPMFHTRLD